MRDAGLIAEAREWATAIDQYGGPPGIGGRGDFIRRLIDALEQAQAENTDLRDCLKSFSGLVDGIPDDAERVRVWLEVEDCREADRLCPYEEMPINPGPLLYGPVLLGGPTEEGEP